MPKNCSIPGCTNRSNKEDCQAVPFYALPKDIELRQRWLISIKKPITVSNYTYVCGDHFEGGLKSKDNPIPTIFPWSEPCQHRKPPTDRMVLPPPPKRSRQEQPECHSAKCQDEIDTLQARCTELEEELKASKIERFGLRRFQGNDGDIRFYTGLPTYNIFLCLFRYLEPLLPYLRYRPSKHDDPTPQLLYRTRILTPIDELFMVMVRLRLGLLEQDLAHRFNVSIATVYRVCSAWLSFLHQQLRPLITWPSRSVIKKHMPTQFVELYPNTRVIVDCTEIFIETPSSLNIQSSTYSSYKHHNTFKGLVGISPSGACIFVSALYTGNISDREIARRSGFLEYIQPGDSVMADKGFDLMYDLVIRQATLNIPPFAGSSQMPKEQVVKTRKITSFRIHVERAIGRVKQYHIISNTLPLSLAMHADDICDCVQENRP